MVRKKNFLKPTLVWWIAAAVILGIYTQPIAARGGVIRTAISAEPDNLDPWLSAAADTQAVMYNVFEGLIRFNEKGELLPGLAESYKISPDGLTYTFKLRKNVKFHNGSKLRAADVKYSLEKLSGLSGAKALSSKFSRLARIQTPADDTVILTLKERDAAFLSACITPILPKGYHGQSKKPVGTGPFKFVSYSPGQSIVIEKNRNYYDRRKMAKVDRVEFRIMTDPGAILMALKAGDLDMAGIDGQNVAALKSDFTVLKAPQNMVQLLALNNARKPFNNLKVRQAINYAIDKEAIITAVANGFGTKLSTNMSPIMKFYYQDGLDIYKTNIPKAKRLLQEAGYPAGFTTTLTVPSNYQFHVDTAQVIAAQLLKVGIKMKIKPIEWGQWLDQVYTKANYDCTIICLTGKLDPNEVLGRYESSFPKNFFRFSDHRYDQLIKLGTKEVNEAKRAKIYRECQKILTRQAAAVYIMDPNLVVILKKNLKGFKFYPVRFLDMSSMYYE